MNQSRRHFLRAAGGLSLASASQVPFALSLAGMSSLATAASGTQTGYKALVCLFMNGGNDSHNCVVPIDSSGYAEYARYRGALAIPAASLQGISTTTSQGSGRAFAMPNELAPLKNIYDRGHAAIVANVGPLARPITKADFDADRNLPLRLFSHNDQASTWQSLSPEGARSGWGGRMGDILMSSNSQPVFTAISPAGNAVFLAGSSVSQYQVTTEGSVSVKGLSNSYLMRSSTTQAALRRVLADDGSNPFQSEYKRIVQRSIDTDAALRAGLASVSPMAIPSTSIRLGTGGNVMLNQDSLALQLRMVAQIIGAQQALGMRRQVFMVQLNGFDTHANQLRDHPSLMARTANAIEYFYNAIGALGLTDSVTLFTASDFGRTLTSNGSGSDHGWGSHHFVVGGAVKGGDIYGRFPTTAVNTADDVGSGRLLPSQSVTQYAATLGKWMGVSDSDLTTVLPGLTNFSNRNLGFI